MLSHRNRFILFVLTVVLLSSCEPIPTIAPRERVIAGPPGPSPEAEVLLAEEAVRVEFRSCCATAEHSGGQRVIVLLGCDLDEEHRGMLLERLADLPADFHEPAESDSLRAAGIIPVLRMSVTINWVNDHHVKGSAGFSFEGSGQGQFLGFEAEYASGNWHIHGTNFGVIN